MSIEPLVNPYLWVLGDAAQDLEPETLVADRYRVIAPQVWLDTQPEQPLTPPDSLARELLPYLYLYPKRLHLPVVYDVCSLGDRRVTLLENGPIEGAGSLQPRLVDLLPQVRPIRQLNWLWQILQLWGPLRQTGVVASLLQDDNLRVEGWRLRLRELYAAMGNDAPLGAGLDSQRYDDGVMLQPDLLELGQCWSRWLPLLHGDLQEPIGQLCDQLQSDDASFDAVAASLNTLLLKQSAQTPLKLQLLGATDQGPNLDHNEDTCYPQASDLKRRGQAPDNLLIPKVAIVCDGIGGHEGGEVASQLAVRSLKLQLQALLSEIGSQKLPLSPETVMQQLSASVRVVNNLIDAQNNAQERKARQRMGTTLVMALHLRQNLGDGNQGHELYLAHVGDSRAYWITPRYCQALTIDNDVACREVRQGRSFYRQALGRSDAGAITQALGTRDGEQLQVTVQRFVLDEDGLLLLCSDGLSDNGRVEYGWADAAVSVLSGAKALDVAVQSWIDLANSRNGHDNVSVVLGRCRISPEASVVLDSNSDLAIDQDYDAPEELTAASAALLEDSADVAPIAKPRGGGWVRTLLALLVILGLGGAIGYLAFKQFEQPKPSLPESQPEESAPESAPESVQPSPEPLPPSLPPAPGQPSQSPGASLSPASSPAPSPSSQP